MTRVLILQPFPPLRGRCNDRSGDTHGAAVATRGSSSILKKKALSNDRVHGDGRAGPSNGVVLDLA